MQPNQPPQYSIDYLNQIAPPSSPPPRGKKILLVVALVGVILVLLAGFLFLISSLGQAGPRNLETLSARLQTLQAVAGSSQKDIKSGTLRSVNSSLSLYLTEASRELNTLLPASGVNPKKIDKNTAQAENGSRLKAALEKGRLNAVFDRTYTREMSYELARLSVLMKQIYTQTDNKALKELLQNTDANLQPIKKQLAEFNAASS